MLLLYVDFFVFAMKVRLLGKKMQERLKYLCYLCKRKIK